MAVIHYELMYNHIARTMYDAECENLLDAIYDWCVEKVYRNAIRDKCPEYKKARKHIDQLYTLKSIALMQNEQGYGRE